MPRTTSIGNLSAVISGNADLLAQELGKAKSAINSTVQGTSDSFNKLSDSMEKTGLKVIAGGQIFRKLHAEIRDVIANVENIPEIPGATLVSVQRMRGEFELAQNSVQRGIANMVAFISDVATSIGALMGSASGNIFGEWKGLDGVDEGLQALNNDMEKAARLTPQYQAQLKAASAQLDELNRKYADAGLTQAAKINALTAQAAGLRASAAHFDGDDIANNLEKQIAARRDDIEAKQLQFSLDEKLATAERELYAAQKGENVATMSRAEAIDAYRQRIAALQSQIADASAAYKQFHDPVIEEKIIQLTKDETAAQTALNGQLKANVDWANQLGSAFASTFDSAILNGTRFSDLITSLGKDILGVFAKLAVVNPLINAIFGGSGLNATGFKALPSLFGFATGGDFTVGGGGGTDSQLVAFRATPGEAVSVRTPGQQAAGSGGGDVYNTFNWSFGAGVTAAQVAGMIPSIIEQTKSAVADSVRRGGAYRGAFA
jgi:hypothetical protein